MLAAFIAMSSFAQISQRVNDQNTFKYGAQPQAGDWGINIQPFAIPGDSGTHFLKQYFNGMPIINVQYYLSNNLALRAGLRASKHKTVFSGDVYNPNPMDGDPSKGKYKSSSREYMVYLGIEKHFAPTNLLDVYMGAQIPLGFSGSTSINNIDYVGGGKNYSTIRTNSIVYGLEAFLGLQLFIADLPIAVGLEWGYAGYGKLSDKTYTMTDNGTTKTEFYTTSSAPGARFKSLSSRTFDAVSMTRMRLSYYFNR